MNLRGLRISPALHNRNILFIMISTPFLAIAISLSWFSYPFLVKAFVVEGEATALGRIGALSTFISLIASFITAGISDRYRRDVMIWSGIIPNILSLWILSSASNVSEVLIGAILNSFAWGLTNPAQNALLADSTLLKSRNIVYGWQFWLFNVFFGGGNVLGYFLFQAAGSELNVALLQIAMRIGLILTAIGGIFLLFVKDKYRIPAEEDHVYGIEDNNSQVTGFTTHGFYVVLSLIGATSILLGLGSGISITFFNYFFNEIYAMNLANLSLIFAAMQILTGFLGKWVANQGTKYNRVKVVVMAQLIAVVLLYMLATYPPLIIAILAMLTRNATMNAAGPLTQAMMMDHSPRTKRASITTVANVSWTLVNGIAQALGGMLIDSRGYRYAFFTTATIYLISTIWIATIREQKSTHEHSTQ